MELDCAELVVITAPTNGVSYRHAESQPERCGGARFRAGAIDLGIHGHLSNVTKEVKIEHNSRGPKM